MHTLGITHVVARLEYYQGLLGDNFTPAASLKEMVEEGRSFY
jgi:3-hydroxyacyl-CoA dehydrogenase/enoyl-CoA hydratase/3-hydroxybutyryl-CoA epimerase